MDSDKNCGVCIHSSVADGRYCEHPKIVQTDREIPVGIARSASVSECGPDALLHEPCQCLEPSCPRHGKDRRR